MTDLLRHRLVNRSARVNVSTRGLSDPDPGEESGARAAVIAGTVRSGIGAEVIQAGNDLKLVLTLASGCSVGDNSKSAPPAPAGHQAFGIVPLGT